MLKEKILVDVRCLPTIEPVFGGYNNNFNNLLYRNAIQNALEIILPDRFYANKADPAVLTRDLKDHFHTALPVIKTTHCSYFPSSMSCLAVSKYRANSVKFFFDVIGTWLLPPKKIDINLHFAADFRLPELGNEVYSLFEAIIQVANVEEFITIKNQLPTVEKELRLGLPSCHYAQKLLEVKTLSADQKNAGIQDHISLLMSKFPEKFDHEILTEMQHVLLMSSDEFKGARHIRHLSRIIGIHYHFRKWLQHAVKVAPKKRHLNLKLFKTKLKASTGEKRILGVLVGVNFISDKEVFEEIHLLKAIQNYIGSAKVVENSFFANRRGNENICTLYVEIEKESGEDFTAEEIKILRRELPADLKDRIEQLMYPVFMPRNEEEIIRNILSLSNQIKYLRDIPQVFISFDEQTSTSLFFTIILVRVLRPGSVSIQEMFKNSHSFLEYIHDRCQNAGSLRRKYTKEAVVFRVKFPKEQFLRRDHSIDLNKARQAVVSELCCIVGEVRDYNGGMISKQNELICEVKHLLADKKLKYSDLLLENFFYSITPVIMRSVLEPQALRSLFFMFLKSIEEGFIDEENYSFSLLKEARYVYVMIKTEDRSLKDILNRALAKLQLHSSELAHSYVLVHDIAYLGYIYRCDEPIKQRAFSQIIQTALLDIK